MVPVVGLEPTKNTLFIVFCDVLWHIRGTLCVSGGRVAR